MRYIDPAYPRQRELPDLLKKAQDQFSEAFKLAEQTKPITIDEPVEGIKETEGKLNYELDFTFISSMAGRMAANKGKYPPFNWKKKMEVGKLKQSLFRHVLSIMEGIYKDDGREYGHIEAAACNLMMILYQLKNYENNSDR